MFKKLYIKINKHDFIKYLMNNYDFLRFINSKDYKINSRDCYNIISNSGLTQIQFRSNLDLS